MVKPYLWRSYNMKNKLNSARQAQQRIHATVATLALLLIFSSPLFSMSKAPVEAEEMKAPEVWVHRGFDGFSQGHFENAGNNLYVNAKGVIEIINHFDVNSDGYVDIILANSHDRVERGPTWVFTPEKGSGENWKRHQMSADSGWMSRVIDVDGDSHNDLVTVNAHNGVTSELPCYIYWGGPDGLEASRTDLPTIGAYDVLALDINRDGRLDLITPSAWKDSHNPAKPRLAHIYIQGENRSFEDRGKEYEVMATGALGIAARDLNNDGYADIVLASYREGRVNLNTESLLYWGTEDGVNAEEPFILPTYGARQVILDDLNRDGSIDITFSGSGQVRVYWNEEGNIDRENPVIIEAAGHTAEFSSEVIRVDISDVDADEIPELLIATSEGVQIRSGDNLEKVKATVKVKNSRWITAADLDGDELPELIISKHYEGNEFRTKSPIYWNGPDGYSDENTSWVPTIGVVGNTVGDLNGDGTPEVIFNNVDDGHVHAVPSYVYFGNAEAEYSVENRLELETIHGNNSLVADLNLDGYPEVVFGVPDRLRIYDGMPAGISPDKYTDINTGHVAYDLETADFNRDGYLDLLSVALEKNFSGDSGKTSIIYYGSADGFSNSRIDRLKNHGFGSTIGDVNNDGHLDIAFHDLRNQLLIYFGQSDGFSESHMQYLPCAATGDAVRLNLADLNNDGWLDLIAGILGTRLRHKDTLRIFFGSPDGYDPENIQEYFGGYSARYTGVADYNNDGNLDLMVSAYATPTTRVPPAQLFWGNGKGLDLENPVNFKAFGSGDVIQIDLNRDGWIDIVLACHRDDIGHQVDSLIYWNGPDGFFAREPTRLPCLGPHGMYANNHGNAFTRKPEENYFSPPFELGGREASHLYWESEETELLRIKFQLRWGVTEEALEAATWSGPYGDKLYYESSGEAIQGIPNDAQWLQYKATLVSPYGCGSPKLKEVRIE